MVKEIISKFQEFRRKTCPKCRGSGTEEVFSYMLGVIQPMPEVIKCRICKGKGYVLEGRIRGLK